MLSSQGRQQHVQNTRDAHGEGEGEGLIGQVGGSGTASPKSEGGAVGNHAALGGVWICRPRFLLVGLSLRTSLPLLPQSRALSRGLSGCAQHSGPGSPHWPTLRWHSITLFSLLVLCPFPVFSVRFCLAPSSFCCCFPGRAPLSHRPVTCFTATLSSPTAVVPSRVPQPGSSLTCPSSQLAYSMSSMFLQFVRLYFI